MNKSKEEILNNSANNTVGNIDRSQLYDVDKYLPNPDIDKNSFEYREYVQWYRIIQEYGIIQKKESFLTRREREEVVTMVEALIENKVVEFNEDFSIKNINFTGKIDGE